MPQASEGAGPNRAKSLLVEHGLPVAVGLVLAIAVGRPWIGTGWLLLLDYVPGPRSYLPGEAWGLGSGVTASVPFYWLNLALRTIVGDQTASWMLVLAFFPLGVWSLSRALHGAMAARLTAGVFFVVNPFVFERLWAGQIALLLGAALMPLLLATVLARRGQNVTVVSKTGLVWALAAAFSVHFLWIGALVVLAGTLARPTVKAFVQSFCSGLLMCGCSIYLFVSSRTPGLPTRADLDAYASYVQPELGSLGTTATLYGFWRTEPELPISLNSWWPFVFCALVALMIAGVWAAVRSHDVQGRAVVTASAVMLAVGTFLSPGVSGPFEGVYRWAFESIPGFGVMRESQKFSILVLLAYSLCLGLGVHAIATALANWLPSRRSVTHVAPAVIAILLTAAYTPTMLDGFDSRLDTSEYPQSWHDARKMLDEPGKTLYLPWHQYMSSPFTNGRIVANLLPPYFGEGIASDAVELPGLRTTSTSQRSRVIEQILDAGPSSDDAGSRLADVGVRYVVLGHLAHDWQSYGWLRNQSQLDLIYGSEEITVFENFAFRGEVFAATDPAAIEKVNATRTNFEIFLRRPATVTVTEPFGDQWAAQGSLPIINDAGVMHFDLPAGRSLINYETWSDYRSAYLLSVVVLAVALVTSSCSAISFRKRNPSSIKDA